LAWHFRSGFREIPEVSDVGAKFEPPGRQGVDGARTNPLDSAEQYGEIGLLVFPSGHIAFMSAIKERSLVHDAGGNIILPTSEDEIVVFAHLHLFVEPAALAKDLAPKKTGPEIGHTIGSGQQADSIRKQDELAHEALRKPCFAILFKRFPKTGKVTGRPQVVDIQKSDSFAGRDAEAGVSGRRRAPLLLAQIPHGNRGASNCLLQPVRRSVVYHDYFKVAPVLEQN